MATDLDALVVEWAADQVLNPLDPVDYFVKDADGNYEPVSGGAGGGVEGVTAKKPDVFSMNKGELKRLAKEHGFDDAVSADVWQLPVAQLRQAIAEALRLSGQ